VVTVHVNQVDLFGHHPATQPGGTFTVQHFPPDLPTEHYEPGRPGQDLVGDFDPGRRRPGQGTVQGFPRDALG